MEPPDFVLAAGWLVGWVLLFRVPRLAPRARAAAPTGPLTVVIPARNEAATLPLLLSDLAAARPPGTHVVVVDDGSEDGTREVARAAPFAEVIAVPPAEPGWLGKAWACHHGAARAERGTLVFLDADVRLKNDALACVVALCEQRGGLVTVWPRHEVERPYEHLSALPTLATLMSVGCGSLLPSPRPRCGFGPVMACSLADYRACGGHAAVRADVVDDFALARRFAEAGRRVTNLGGGREIGFRMYPHGVRGLVQGWTKSLGGGAKRVPWWRLAGILFWLTCSIGVLTWAHGLPRLASFVFYGLFAAQWAVQLRQAGTFGILDAALYPLHVGFLAWLFARSLWHTFVRREVRWRGRDVPLQPADPASPGPGVRR